ncbi:hypothetical protein GCM10010218_06540 [Streptomyces mashuensis]|uniref:Uncharacterized protein n=1 Tax=Streptomyces mashuensis TaxID=33904 RepID=A0A919AV77_9ACTN|nr:hypothetical protein GCM10010218_06540 [Streptomyces mashuensis]
MQQITALERKFAATGTHPSPDTKAEQWQGTESIPGVTPGVDEAAMVRQELLGLDVSGRRMTAALEPAMERLLDGELTGRFRWESSPSRRRRWRGSPSRT